MSNKNKGKIGIKNSSNNEQQNSSIHNLLLKFNILKNIVYILSLSLHSDERKTTLSHKSTYSTKTLLAILELHVNLIFS